MADQNRSRCATKTSREATEDCNETNGGPEANARSVSMVRSTVALKGPVLLRNQACAETAFCQ